MRKSKVYPVLQALLAAVLFGISTPLAKLLLGDIAPVPLAAFLYLGSGIGLLLFQVICASVTKLQTHEAPLVKRDIPWLLGAIIFGGVAAPIISMVSLQHTPASTASLLLNFEGAATTLIALFVFKEYIGKRAGLAVALMIVSSILLSWDTRNAWGISLGALGILLACICWGIDNNLTRQISSKNPFTIVSVKGLCAGLFSLAAAWSIGSPLPDFKAALLAMLLGFFSYGLSIVLFVFAMRNLGSARTSAFFGTSPFIGALLSFAVFQSVPNITFLAAFPMMIFGTILLLKDKHTHAHRHEAIVHAHRHVHTDAHHSHTHPGALSPAMSHSHPHAHEALAHSHDHLPDISHRHTH